MTKLTYVTVGLLAAEVEDPVAELANNEVYVQLPNGRLVPVVDLQWNSVDDYDHTLILYTDED